MVRCVKYGCVDESEKLHSVYTDLDKYPQYFRGTVRTPTVASGSESCFQTVYLGPGVTTISFRAYPILHILGNEKGCNPFYLDRTVYPCHLNPSTTDIRTHSVMDSHLVPVHLSLTDGSRLELGLHGIPP